MTQQKRVLQMLKDAGEAGCTTGDFLAAYVPRFSARVEELREAGYCITTERLTASSFRYVLVPQPERLPNNPASSQPLSGSGTSTALFDLPKPSRSAISGRPL